MKIVFISNFLNHHQLPLCKEFSKISDFVFIAHEEFNQNVVSKGYVDMNNKYPFVYRSYENEKKKTLNIVNNADIVIIGQAPNWYIKRRMEKNKIVYRYSERFLRNGSEWYKYLYRFFKLNYYNPKNKNIYLLCAGAYVYSDYRKFGLFVNKGFKWGYFPEVNNNHNIEDIIKNKHKNQIIWVGRLIELKHPEIVINLAKKLKENNYEYKLKIIGEGPLKDKITSLVEKYDLKEDVEILGAMKPECVRIKMKESKLFVFTSDEREGWGAVLNESMSSACIPIVYKGIGSAPYLVKNNENGYIYDSFDELYSIVTSLLENNRIIEKIAIKSYEEMNELWNAKIAAKRLIQLTDKINRNDKEYFTEGPCSPAWEYNE